PDIVELLKSVLEPTCECFSAANGLEGLQRAAVGDPDMVICDIMMPVMDGWEFMERLREDPRLGALPVIFLSALGQRSQIEKGSSVGAQLYVTKPIDPARFRRLVEIFIHDHGITGRPKALPIERIPSARAPKGARPGAPQHAAEAAESDRPTGIPADAKHQPRVMIVDDDRDTCRLIQAVLRHDCELLVTFDGIQ